MSKPEYEKAKKTYKPVMVELTGPQIAVIEPIMDICRLAAGASHPGMVVAQISGRHMKVGFLTEEKARKLAARDDAGNPTTMQGFALEEFLK